MTNAISWFEIPVKNLERAKSFYGAMLAIEITNYHMDHAKYGMFSSDDDNTKVTGALIQMEGLEPSTQGTTVYLNGGDDLGIPLARVESSGGTILMPKTNIGENGFMAQILDTEGNKVALHSWA
jgi:predicted enzyme related to lactoylglutathione lyase